MKGSLYLGKRLKPPRNSLLNLHQCRQCGLIFHARTKPVFSWDRKFMIDKCKTCKEFGYGIISIGVIA
jgi:hypothetical protein